VTYTSERDKLSRQPLYIVELDLDTKISSTGKEYLSQGEQPLGQEFWPCVQSIKWIPTRTKEDGGLGLFGDVVIKCKDFPCTTGNGTYFGRLIANNNYYLNRAVKIWVGFYRAGDTFSFSNFVERRYFLKAIDGPDEKGNVTIKANDILSRLKESQVPEATKGNLNASLDSSTTGTLNIQDNTGFPNAAGYCIIDDEIVAYSSTSGADSIVTTARGQGGTTAASHDADAPVRYIYHYNGHPTDAVKDLIENHTDIASSYIPTTDWTTEKNSYMSGYTVDIWVKEPTDVDKIIHKIGQQNYFNVFWDDEAQEIKLKTLGPTLNNTASWNDDEHILDERVSIKRDQRKILSEVWVFYGKLNQSKGNDAENFENVYIKIDSNVETGLGEVSVKKIFADYLPSSQTSVASTIAARLISQNKTPLELTFYVDAKDSDLEVGQAVNVTTGLIQGIAGDPVAKNMRIIERSEELGNRYKYKLICSGIDPGDRYARIGPNTLNDYISESDANRADYGFICNNSELMSNNDDPYLIAQ
jgi:hypothetical protein